MGTVAAISSLVLRGAVGLRPIVHALERRGYTVWAVPTVMMPWQPLQGPSTRTVPPDFDSHLWELTTRAHELDAVMTGYFATANQVRAAARFVDAVRAVRPDAVILVDPVSREEGARYVPDAVVDAIRAELLPRADLATPNVFELMDIAGSDDVLAAARRLGPKSVIVTSAPAASGRTGALLVRGAGVTRAEHDALAGAPRGTGDLFAAVALAAILDGVGETSALHQAAAATYAAVRGSENDLLAFAGEHVTRPPLELVRLTEEAPEGDGG